MTYTNLLFDLDGTLFDFDAGETYAFHKVCDTFHIPYSDEVLSLYQRINLSYWKAYERGEITSAALAIARFHDFLAAVGKDGDPALSDKPWRRLHAYSRCSSCMPHSV